MPTVIFVCLVLLLAPQIVAGQNNPPGAFHLIDPPKDTLLQTAGTIHFMWSESVDPNLDTVTYSLWLQSSQLDTVIGDLSDTSVVFDVPVTILFPWDASWWVVSSDGDLVTGSQDTFLFVMTIIDGLAPDIKSPRSFVLHQNYPNPFNPTTAISYKMPVGAKVSLKIYNILGQEVATLVNGPVSAGVHKAIWNGKNRSGKQVSSGVYIYRIRAVGPDKTFVNSKKIMLIK